MRKVLSAVSLLRAAVLICQSNSSNPVSAGGALYSSLLVGDGGMFFSMIRSVDFTNNALMNSANGGDYCSCSFCFHSSLFLSLLFFSSPSVSYLPHSSSLCLSLYLPVMVSSCVLWKPGIPMFSSSPWPLLILFSQVKLLTGTSFQLLMVASHLEALVFFSLAHLLDLFLFFLCPSSVLFPLAGRFLSGCVCSTIERPRVHPAVSLRTTSEANSEATGVVTNCTVSGNSIW